MPHFVVLTKRLASAVPTSVSDFVVLADTATLTIFALTLPAIVLAEADATTIPASAFDAVVRADSRPFTILTIPLVAFVRTKARTVTFATELLIPIVYAFRHHVPEPSNTCYRG